MLLTKKIQKNLWMPDGAMNAMIVMVHGIGEHGGCYVHYAEKFTRLSVGFLTFDLRGHGNSPGIRGHASIRDIENDLQAIIQNMREKFPDIPIVLFGHSMGGQIVLSYALSQTLPVEGVIASSPYLKLVRPPSPLQLFLARRALHIVPWLTVSTGIKADQLSQNSAATRSTKTDPLLHKKISIRLFTDLWTKGDRILRSKRRIPVPLLLMHGTDDPLTSCQATRSFAQNAGDRVTFKQWSGMRHDLLYGEGSEHVFQYLTKWLSKQVLHNGTI